MTEVWHIEICEECGQFRVCTQQEARKSYKQDRRWYRVCLRYVNAGDTCHGRTAIFRASRADLKSDLAHALERVNRD